MPSGTHCWKHDTWYPSLGECPRCLAEESAERQREHFERVEEAAHDAEEREEERERERERREEEALERDRERQEEQQQRHEELVELRREKIYKHSNPGDYQCPKCLFISLKRGASRCPRCQGDVAPDHWKPIYEAERIEAEERARRARLAAEEWARGEPERQRKAKTAAEERERAALAKQRAKNWKSCLQLYYGYLLPVLTLVSGAFYGYVSVRAPDMPKGWAIVVPLFLLLAPGLNWLVILGLLLSSENDKPLAWAIFLAWGIGGGLLALITKPVSR